MDQASPHGGHERRRHSDTDAFFNSQFNETPVSLRPGEALTEITPDNMIVSQVGAGVLVAFYDLDLKCGAVAYSLMPFPLLDAFPLFEAIPADHIEEALQPLALCVSYMKNKRETKKRIFTRIIGAGEISPDYHDKGLKNYVFAREFIVRQGLGILNEDLGGPYVRRLHFFPGSGKTVRYMLRRQEDFDEMNRLERDFEKKEVS